MTQESAVAFAKRCWPGFVIGLFLAVGTFGCSERKIFPVSGQIVDRAGNPITTMKGGAVEFESLDHKSSANGSIDENGNFKLTTKNPGDGAHVGKNRVLIMRPYIGADQPSPHVLHPRYESQEATDLFVDVEPKDNVVTLTVDRYKK